LLKYDSPGGTLKTKNRSIFKGRLKLGLSFIAAGIFIYFLPYLIFLICIWSVIIYFSYRVLRYELLPTLNSQIATKLMIVYFLVAMIIFAILVAGENGKMIYLVALAAPAIYDAAAYITGKKIGKNKIKGLEKISPNKTWEGTIAGSVISVIITSLILARPFKIVFNGYNSSFSAALIFNPIINLPVTDVIRLLIASLIIVLSAIMGDLLESCYKRAVGIKDSGNSLKGHGGYLDLIDGQLLTIYIMPIIFFLII